MVKYPNKFGYSLVYSYLCTRNRLGNGVRIPDCPAAVSSHSRCEHDVTDIIGKTFATRLQVRIPACCTIRLLYLWG